MGDAVLIASSAVTIVVTTASQGVAGWIRDRRRDARSRLELAAEQARLERAQTAKALANLAAKVELLEGRVERGER